jgi:hypothetical protein
MDHKDGYLCYLMVYAYHEVVLSEYRVLDTLLARTRQQRQLLLMGHDAEQEQGYIFLPADRDSDVETELSV